MQQGFQCSNCRDRKLFFDFAVGAYQGDGLARDLMHRFKYDRKIYLARLLGPMLSDVLEEERLLDQDWVIIPIPLHWTRLRYRGFNQADLLASELKKCAPSSLTVSRALRRTRNTERQAGLDRTERLTNLKDAFALSRFRKRVQALEGKQVLLVDDVLTTGATASECARVLREMAGVETIGVITVLRG